MAHDLTFPGMARDILADLRRQIGLDQWVLTRVAGEDSMVIFTDGELGMAEGSTVPWANSLEARLVDGGPWAAPDLAASPYADAELPVEGLRSFAGAPLTTIDGDLFGAVYGVGREPSSLTPDSVQMPLGLAVRTLALVLANEQAVAAPPAPTAAEGPRTDWRRDPVTGVLSDRGWEEALTVESARCRRYGNAASIVQVLLEGLAVPEQGVELPARDVVLRQAGDALRSWSRGADVIARTAADVFTILLVEVDQAGADRAVRRLLQTLSSRHLVGRLGLADNQSQSLAEAVDVALQRAHQAAPGTAVPNSG